MVLSKRGWIICLFVLLGIIAISNAKLYNSCREMKSAGITTSGVYSISTNIGPLSVFCEMKIKGGGFTFIPKSALEHKKLDLRHIFTDGFGVLLQLRKKTGPQAYTYITPYLHKPMGVQMLSHSGYTSPQNLHLGEYIFLGILRAKDARARNTQGFVSNGKPVLFSNCDANPNNYFAFFPNFYHYKPSAYHGSNLVYESRGVAVEWRKTARPATNRLPHRFFYLAELHFGGCGTYTSSNRWSDANGVAIGLR